MSVTQSFFSNKKEGKISRVERTSVNQQAELMLKSIKEKAGNVVLIAINSKTTIELPAHFSQAERDARVANYLKLHKTKI